MASIREVNAINRRRSQADPAYGLSAQHRFADGDTITAATNFGTPGYLLLPVTFRVDVEVTTLATATGVLFEIGDATTGVALVLDGGDLICAAGGQGNDGADGTATSLFGADGHRRSLVFSILPGTGQVQVHADGALVIDETAVAGVFTSWAANADGEVGDVDTAITARVAAPLRVALANAAVVGEIVVYPSQLPRTFRR